MYLSFFDEKPFYHELDFTSPSIQQYLYSICHNNRDPNTHDLQSIHKLQNIIVYGPRSSGKTTQIYSFLATLFQSRSIYNVTNNIYENNFQYKSSNYHIEISTKHFKNSDIMDDSGRNKNIDFIRNVVQTPNMLLNVPKVLYIRNFDYCSQEIQKFFLRVIEKSMKDVRFILEIQQLSNLSDAIKSRFLLLSTTLPSSENLRYALQRIYDKYAPEKCKEEEEKIIHHSMLYSHIMNFTYEPNRLHYNLKNAFGIMAVYISSFENPHMKRTFYIPNYIKKSIKIKNIILSTHEENFFDNMLSIREILLELFVNNVSSEVIQKYLTFTFMEYFKENREVKNELLDFSTQIDYTTNVSNKDVLFTELFIIFILKKILLQEEKVNKKVEIDDVKVDDVKVDVEVEKEEEVKKKVKRTYKKKVKEVE